MKPEDLRLIASKLPLSKSVLARNTPSIGSQLVKIKPGAPHIDLTTAKPIQPKHIKPPTVTTDEDGLNKSEAAYLGYLRAQRFVWIGVQNLTLKLADRCRYTPDFIVLCANGQLQAHEVKGYFRDDAKVKLKVAARTFRFIEFILVRKTKTGWEHTPVNP